MLWLWRKNGKSAPASNKSAEIGMLGADTHFKGKIRFTGTLRLDGVVEGPITSVEGSGSKLIINQDGVVSGNITSDAVLISGKVEGNIKAAGRVEIYRSGTLRGDISTGDLMVEEGAEFEGTCRMLNHLSPEQRRKVLSATFT